MLYGKLPESTDGELQLEDTISSSCKHLISEILQPNAVDRPTAEQILKHNWFSDTPEVLDIFDEQEKNLISQEFTININEPNNKQKQQLNTGFTEFSISSLPSTQSLKNCSTESLIFSPFNTVYKQTEI